MPLVRRSTAVLAIGLCAVGLCGIAVSACSTATPPDAQPPDVRLAAEAVRHLDAREADLIAFRHDLHRHPELSGEEVRTARVVAERLARLGFRVRTGVGGHGVVGVLEGARPGPTVAFRADMDAVRSQAPDPAPYRSLTPGVRHICGHDVHTAIGVGLAEAFASVQDRLAGSVMLVFQPAEERGTGANAMLRDGAFDEIEPDAIFAVHTAPYRVGEVATVPGGMMAGRAQVTVSIRGDGDLADAEAQVRAALRGVGTFAPSRAREVAPDGFILVQLFRSGLGGAVHTVRAQIMTAGPDDRARAKALVTDALARLDLPGVTVVTAYDEAYMEGVTNDADLVALANAGIRAAAPDIAIRGVPGAVPAFSEDFGSFQARVPGVMYFLGVSNAEAGTTGMPHTPDYVADDGALLVGTRAILGAMLARLNAEP